MKRVVVCVGGSIAAYKACDLVSKLVQAGRQVDVAMTSMACRFVQPLSFRALTHREPFTDDAWGEGAMPHDHLRLTEECDLLVVAPATANLIAKFAHGMADDLVSTTWLAAAGPRLVAPAMNPRMWQHPRTRANVKVLEGDGVRFVGPAEGWLAERQSGLGRMADPPDILREIDRLLA
jgi:phosphopantothenoylcysteine decarboxylase/phosphopantothenate--cysteine ligase